MIRPIRRKDYVYSFKFGFAIMMVAVFMAIVDFYS